MKKRRVRLETVRTNKQEINICKNIFTAFLKEEKKIFGKVKFDFIRYGVPNKQSKNKANAIAIKIHDYIMERCSGYANNPQYVLAHYFQSLFEAIHGSPDFYRFGPNSYTIGKFEQFVYMEEKAEDAPYFRKKSKDIPEIKHFEQDDSWMIGKDGLILSEDACELQDRKEVK